MFITLKQDRLNKLRVLRVELIEQFNRTKNVSLKYEIENIQTLINNQYK